MIHPKHHPIISRIMDRYIRRMVNRNFHEVVYNEIGIDADRSILLIANHYSIWDGLVLYWLNHRLFKKSFHVMILEETSRKESFLKYAGAFSVHKNSRDVLESLNYATQLLADPQNLVLIFPQGKLYSNFVDEVHFESGLQKIISSAKNFQLIFSATFTECFRHKKPTVYIYLNQPDNLNNIDELASAYRQHYNAARQQQTQIIL